MKAAHIVLFLAPLIGSTTCLLFRQYVFVDSYSPWLVAQTYCRQKYDDLATIDSQEELNRFKTDVTDLSIRSWTGLFKNPNQMDYTRWSDGTVFVFGQWQAGKPESRATEHCVSIESAQLNDYHCSSSLPFICYTWQPTLIMVQDLKTWYEALVQCRTQYTDLISLSTDTDLFHVNKKISNIQNVTLWTGLNFLDGSWFWVNNETVTNLFSLVSCPIQPFRCGAKVGVGGVLENADCMKKMNFMCYHIQGGSGQNRSR
ncbi:C-type mannose receptor 2-like isoform X1 [Tachysurus fulvidraco]|uniref:C-type mannose receptor 2-like isoform X1 n=1 Tax=Tachysurus fulvidraco TaxID=1234273 RepID=UPI001FEEBBC3|nr:C-type mannose receptor 2-like isoform X1 [Tachysurus fulvidraco]